MTTLIERNTAIPTSKKRVFTTAADGRLPLTSMSSRERAMAADNVPWSVPTEASRQPPGECRRLK